MKTKNVTRQKKTFREQGQNFVRLFRRDWQLHLMVLIPAIYILIFSYGPMYGVQIAFRNFRPRGGITGSEWVGFKWFIEFLNDFNFTKTFVNTIVLSLYNIATFPLPIIFALILNALRAQKYKKVVQTITYMPHFVSMTVMVSILMMILSPVSGLYGTFYRLFGGDGYPADFRGLEATFRHLYVWSGVWQELGWSSIIYTAALSAVSMELHEAAMIDGASRFKRILCVDFPTIAPSVGIMLIMRLGSIVSVGFEKAFLLQSNLNGNVSEVIATYVYKKGMSSIRYYSYGSAVSLFNTMINLTMLIIVNAISKKITDDEVSIF